MSNLNLETVLGRGPYQASIVFKVKDKYPMVTKWVYTHLLIGSQYFQITNLDTMTMVLEIKKCQGTFQSLAKFFFVNSFMKIICSLKLLK
jgi:hypothetical protein